MYIKIILGILIPFAGTCLGSAAALLFKNPKENMKPILSGFASGVMLAASFWSLIEKSIELSSGMGRLAFVPCGCGIFFGIIILMFVDERIDILLKSEERRKKTVTVLAITIHNIPEGMAIGASFLAFFGEKSPSAFLSAMVLSVGIAVQNIPEGAIVSLPLRNGGMKKSKAFLFGCLSGAVEPVFSVLTIILSGFSTKLLPFILSFAAGNMIYVVLEELIPDFTGNKKRGGIISFTLGFLVMMILDVALG